MLLTTDDTDFTDGRGRDCFIRVIRVIRGQDTPSGTTEGSQANEGGKKPTAVARQSWNWSRLWLRPILIGAWACYSASAVHCSAQKFTLTSKGSPRTEIVVYGEQPPIQFAARELQRYVREMSGAELPISNAPSQPIPFTPPLSPAGGEGARRAGEGGSPRGRAVRAPAAGTIVLGLFSPSGADQSDPRERDRYRLTTDRGRLRIEGASPRAVLFGVYDLLERLGCGWCVPGDDVVPRQPTLELGPLHVDTRPAFSYRMMLDFPLQSIAQSIAIADWIAKNRMNWVHECPNAHGEPRAWYERRDRVIPELANRALHLALGGHTMHTWVSETNFSLHPDWFALDNGERKPPTLCLSSPEMKDELIRNMLHCLERCPEVEVVDLWHPDGTVFCHCRKCTRGLTAEAADEKSLAPAVLMTNAVQSAYLTRYIEFVNTVADTIGRSYPNVMVGPLIYSQTDHAMPDDGPVLSDRVLLGLAHFFRDSYRPLVGEPKSAVNLRFLGNDLTWMAKAKYSYIYEYYNGWTAPYIYPGAEVIVRDLQTLEQLHAQGASSDMYGYTPINMYVAARALWSPQIDWQAVVRDFCLRYYGEVGEAMAQNEIQLEQGIYGLRGYQANGARDAESPERPASGRYLEAQRPRQIAFLQAQIARTKTPRVKARLERALKPWSDWDKEPRFWAFPEFRDAN